MKLTEFIDHQKTLNEFCTRYPDRQELQWAIIAELGEFANSRKGKWAWWKRNDQLIESEPTDRQLEEIADILCFMLVGIIQTDLTIDKWDRSFEFYVENSSYIEKDLQLSILLRCLAERNYVAAFARFFQLCLQLGYDRKDIEAAYLQKVEINLNRWK